MSRDYVGDMAETVVAAVAQAAGRAARGRRRDHQHHRRGRAAALGVAARCAAGAGAHARPSRCVGPVRAAQARDRRASRRDQRAARQAGAGRRVRARGRGGRGGLARPRRRRSPSCSTGPRAAAEQPTARDVPVFRPVHARPSARGDQGLARRLCGRMEMGRDPRPARPRRRRDAALQPHRRRHLAAAFPTSPRRSGRTGVLDGELLVRGADQGVADVHGGAAASFNALQQRLGRKNVSQKMLGALSRRSSGSTTSCSTATRICASCRWTERRAAARSASPRGSIPSGSTSRS